MHVVRDGRIALWRDDWDLNGMLSQAPPWWIEHIAQHTEAEGS